MGSNDRVRGRGAILGVCLGLVLILQSCSGCQESTDVSTREPGAPSSLQKIEPVAPPQDRTIVPLHSYPPLYTKESMDEQAP